MAIDGVEHDITLLFAFVQFPSSGAFGCDATAHLELSSLTVQACRHLDISLFHLPRSWSGSTGKKGSLCVGRRVYIIVDSDAVPFPSIIQFGSKCFVLHVNIHSFQEGPGRAPFNGFVLCHRCRGESIGQNLPTSTANGRGKT